MRKYISVIIFLALLYSCSGKNEKLFTFVQLCDTQLGMGGYEHDTMTFKAAVRQINDLGPDFVIICGDLVHDSNVESYRDFKNIKKDLEMKCYPVPGNHDVGNNPNDTTLSFYREIIGPDYYNFTFKDYSFIAINTQLWKVQVSDESRKQDKWIESILADPVVRKNPVFVFGHFPLYIESPDEEETYFSLPPAKRKEILNLFTRYNVCAYLSGHSHRTIINQYKSIQLVSGETTSKNFDERPFGFRLWEVYPDTVMQQFVPLKIGGSQDNS